MKIVRILANLIGVCCLCIGILLYIVHDASINVISGEIVNQISEQMNDILFSSLDSIRGSSIIEKAEQYLPQNFKNEMKKYTDDEADSKIADIKEELLSSNELKEISNNYMGAILDGIIDGNAIMPNLEQDIKKLSKTYIPKLSSAFHVDISDKQAEWISDRLIEKVNLQTAASQIVDGIHDHLSDNQRQVLRIVRLIQGERAQWLALAFLVIGLFLVVTTTKSAVKWTWYVGTAFLLCGGLMWIGTQMIQWTLQNQLQGNGEVLMTLSDGLFDALRQKGITLCVFGFGCFGSYGLLNKIKKYGKR